MRRTRSKRDDAKVYRDEILRAAAPFVKVHGVAAPVDEIMKAAGVTSGALYSHFAGKADLCNQVICRALDDAVAWFRSMLNEHGRAGMRLIVDHYLSEDHVAAVAEGCPFVALSADMAKADAQTRRLYETRVQALLATVADGLAGPPKARQRAAARVMAAMLGAVALARSMADPALVADLLSQARASVLRELR